MLPALAPQHILHLFWPIQVFAIACFCPLPVPFHNHPCLPALTAYPGEGLHASTASLLQSHDLYI